MYKNFKNEIIRYGNALCCLLRTYGSELFFGFLVSSLFYDWGVFELPFPGLPMLILTFAWYVFKAFDTKCGRFLWKSFLASNFGGAYITALVWL